MTKSDRSAFLKKKNPTNPLIQKFRKNVAIFICNFTKLKSQIQLCNFTDNIMAAAVKVTVCTFRGSVSPLNLGWCMKKCYNILLLSTVKIPEKKKKKEKKRTLIFPSKTILATSHPEVKLLMAAPVEPFSSVNQWTVAICGASLGEPVSDPVKQSIGKQVCSMNSGHINKGVGKEKKWPYKRCHSCEK